MIRLVRCMRGLLRKFQLWQMAESVKTSHPLWKLKPGVLWSDGTPFTSADVVFTADYCIGEPGCYQEAKFEGVKSVDAVDDLTVKISFEKPMPNPYGPFVGSQTPILQRRSSELYRNKRQECTAENFGPIGTGAFVVTDFKPNDVIQMKANENYREAGKPRFATLVFKVVETLPVPVGPSWKRGNMIMRGTFSWHQK